MLRNALLLFLTLMILAGTVAIALFRAIGWQVIFFFPLFLYGLLWVGKRMVSGFLKNLPLRLFSMKSVVLKNARLEVHSVRPALTRRVDAEVDGLDSEDDKPRCYHEIDLTITPTDAAAGRLWEPGELILASDPIKTLEDLSEKQVGEIHELRVWSGEEFSGDESGKYPGEQRLKVVFAVDPGITRAYLQYYNECIGPVDLPFMKPDATAPLIDVSGEPTIVTEVQALRDVTPEDEER